MQKRSFDEQMVDVRMRQAEHIASLVGAGESLPSLREPSLYRTLSTVTKSGTTAFSRFCEHRGLVPLDSLCAEQQAVVRRFQMAVVESMGNTFNLPAIVKPGRFERLENPAEGDSYVVLGPNDRPTHVTFLTEARYRYPLNAEHGGWLWNGLYSKPSERWVITNIPTCLMISAPLWDERQMTVRPVFIGETSVDLRRSVYTDLKREHGYLGLSGITDEAIYSACCKMGILRAVPQVARRNLLSVNESGLFVSIRGQKLHISYHAKHLRLGEIEPVVCSLGFPHSSQTLSRSKMTGAYMIYVYSDPPFLSPNPKEASQNFFFSTDPQLVEHGNSF